MRCVIRRGRVRVAQAIRDFRVRPVLTRRWAVERSFGWITHWRLMRDYKQRLDASAACRANGSVLEPDTACSGPTPRATTLGEAPPDILYLKLIAHHPLESGVTPDRVLQPRLNHRARRHPGGAATGSPSRV